MKNFTSYCLIDRRIANQSVDRWWICFCCHYPGKMVLSIHWRGGWLGLDPFWMSWLSVKSQCLLGIKPQLSSLQSITLLYELIWFLPKFLHLKLHKHFKFHVYSKHVLQLLYLQNCTNIELVPWRTLCLPRSQFSLWMIRICEAALCRLL